MSETLPARIGAAAVQLRLSGASYPDIAETLGLSDARSALRLVTNELAAHADEQGEEKDRLRTEEDARLLNLFSLAYAKAENRDDPEQLQAIRTCVTIADRRIKLHGLDAPTEIAIHTPTQTELEQWVNAMSAQAMPLAALEEPDIIDAEVIE